MKDSVTRSISHSRVSRLAFALACAAAVACSGTYPLGDISQEEQPLGGSEPTAGAQSRDARVDALLAAPDVSISSVEARLDTLVAAGDMDGDGNGDMAITATDDVTGVSYVQVRYGGPRPLDAEAAFAFERSGAALTLTHDSGLRPVAAGDVDGDGRGDLIVQTAECDVSRPGDGAYLVYGGERMTGTVSLAGVATRFVPPSREGDATNGFACVGSPRAAGPGDMDGDGIDDLVLASSPDQLHDHSLVFDTGEGVYVFYGRAERFSGEVQFSEADVSFHIADEVNPFAVGDVNGDGLAELLITPVEYDSPPSKPGSFMLAGRAQRYGGQLELAANSLLIAGAVPGSMNAINDLDGDGINDLLLGDAQRRLHLFYGSPAALDAGFDLEQADAVFPQSEVSQAYPVGDRDGDGDDELIDFFTVPGALIPFGADVAFASGSRERLSGAVVFPESEVIAQTPRGRFPTDPYRWLSCAVPAGDLDGDGAADLFTASTHSEPLADGYYQPGAYQLHIHYGTPASLPRDPR